MAYSSYISRILANQFVKFASLNRHQLVGQLANLDFWTAEVRHCLEAIDGYTDRFEKMNSAQMMFVSTHETTLFYIDDPFDIRSSVAPPRRVSSQEHADARRQLCDAFHRFLDRCVNECFLDERTVRELYQTLEKGGNSSDSGQ